jgi:hypothetical protein
MKLPWSCIGVLVALPALNVVQSMLIRFPPNKSIPWSEELPLAKSASGSLFFNSEEK